MSGEFKERKRRLLSLVVDGQFQEIFIKEYLADQKLRAMAGLRKLTNTPEQNGFYKGVLQLIEDQEGLALALSKELHKAPEKNEPVSLDG